MDLRPYLTTVSNGGTLSEAEAESAFNVMMSGDATPAQIGGLLMGMRVRGETTEELIGAARAMRSHALNIKAPPGAIDTCGTGGDAKGTLNISTAVALVVAGAGVPVAKHGNRAASSKSGSSDVLSALGVNINADMSLVERALWETNIAFLMAPRHHGAMRHVAGVRTELGTRTIFNLLGPLSNPAEAPRQLMGIFAADYVERQAKVLSALGSERAWVVHGSDGMDELTTTGPSTVAELRDGTVRTFQLDPETVGIPRCTPDDLLGGTPDENAVALKALLDGEKGAYRDIVLFNAAAALVVAEKAENLEAGVAMAANSIDAGKASAALAKLVAITNEDAPVDKL
ncbi:MAG: anthranilate phosphoribosyltransferase [Alphaproteobacteria bacterium]